MHFKFNGWGNKFEKCESIKELPKILLEKLKIKRFTSDLILEGGGVSFDGQGTMVTTEQMLMHKNRNAAFSKLQIEKEVKDLLGIQKVIWLKKGLVEDEGTDGHVDCVAEYLAPQKVLVQTVYDKSNPNYELLKINLEILKAKNMMRREINWKLLKCLTFPTFRNSIKILNTFPLTQTTMWQIILSSCLKSIQNLMKKHIS